MLRFARRRFLHLIAGAGSLTAVDDAMAGAYPPRPVRMTVGLPPGNSPDIVARVVCQGLSAKLAQPVLVENRRQSVFPDLLGGQVQVAFEPVPAVIGFLRAGKLRGLAVSTRRRIAVLPALPALDEFLPGYQATGWIGIGAPKNTPVAVIDTLNRAVNAGLADPQLKARLAEFDVVTDPMTPAAFKNFIAVETKKWGKVVKLAKITVQ